MKRKLLFALIYFLFGNATYFLFLYLTFPSDVARDRILYEANKAGVRMQLDGFRPSLPSGVTLTSVDVYSFGNKPTTRRTLSTPKSEPGEPPLPGAPGILDEARHPPDESSGAQAASAETPILSLDRVTISSLLPLVLPGMIGGPIEASADLYGGTLDAKYEKDNENAKILVTMANVDLTRFPIKSENFDLKTAGIVGLNIDTLYNSTKIRETNGKMELIAPTLTIQKGSKAHGMELPEMAFKVTGGSMEIKNGRVELGDDGLLLESAPLTIKVTGTILLNTSLPRSRFNLKVSLKFGEELSLIANFLSSSARGEDGQFHYLLSGTLDNLNPRPDRIAARGSNTSSSISRSPSRLDSGSPLPGPRPPGLPAGLPDPMDAVRPDSPVARTSPMDDAERDRLREERRARAEERRKRREELRQKRLDGGEGPAGMPPIPHPPFEEVEGEDFDGERVRPARRVKAREDEGGDEMIPEMLEEAEEMLEGNDGGIRR